LKENRRYFIFSSSLGKLKVGDENIPGVLAVLCTSM